MANSGNILISTMQAIQCHQHTMKARPYNRSGLINTEVRNKTFKGPKKQLMKSDNVKLDFLHSHPLCVLNGTICGKAEGVLQAFNLPLGHRLSSQGTARGHRFAWLPLKLFHRSSFFLNPAWVVWDFPFCPPVHYYILEVHPPHAWSSSTAHISARIHRRTMIIFEKNCFL